jgi:WD40 repeat protein
MAAAEGGMRRLVFGHGKVRTLWFSPESRFLLVRESGGHGAELLHVYDLAADRELYRLPLGPAQWVAVSPDCRQMAFAVPRNRDWMIFCRPIDPESPVQPNVLHWSKGLLLGLAFSPDGQTLAGAGSWQSSAVTETGVRRWKGDGSGPRPTLSVPWAVYALAYSADGRWLAGGDVASHVRVWDAEEHRRADLSHPAMVHRLVFHPEATHLAAVCGLGVTLWTIPDGVRAAELGPHPGDVLDTAFAPDGRSIATVGPDEQVRIWSLGGGLLTTCDWEIGQVRAVAFAPDGLTMACGGDHGQVVIWDQDPSL